ncbi:MAG: FIST C-terminal domain-containing protein [Firmicutes bacterium]|nr:FIST C-terminal domain-containing protein [Bacillota bacterium]
MFINLDREGTVKRLQYLLKQADDDENTSGILILACDANSFTPEMVDEVLKQCKKPLFGGIFSRILFNKEILEKGTIVAGISQPVSTAVIRGVSDMSTDLDAIIEQTFEWQSLEDKTMFVFVDGLSQHISALIESMFNCWGLLPNYIGGGAGSLTFERKPCVFTEEGLLGDAAVFALADIKSGVGVAHGWKPVAGPLKVTEADRNTIISLNCRPAFEVYRETVEKISGESFDNTNFFQLAKGFPFGIIKMAEEMVVRDPIALDGSRLICVGEVPLNSFVYILKGDKDSLITGAAKARQLAEASYWKTLNEKKEKPLTTFFMDCVSRVLFLQSDFNEELEAVYAGYPLLGALTIGEIANTGKDYLEFYNKTSVIGLLED